MPTSPAPVSHRVSFHPSSPIATRSSSLSPTVSPSGSPATRGRHKRKSPDQDGDDVSERARSEASTQGESLSVWGGSKRARQLIQLAQKHEESLQPDRIRLTHEVVSMMSQGPPAFNLRSRGSQPVQTSIRDFTAATRNSHKAKQEVTSALKFVSDAVGNGDSSDILKLSVALGYVLESPGARAPAQDVSYLDDIMGAFTPQLRKAAKENLQAVRTVLKAPAPDLRELARILLRDGMGGLLAGHGGRETDFLFRAATKHKCVLSSAGRVSGSLCLWHFVLSELLKSDHDLRTPRLRVLLHEEEAWLSIKFADAEKWRHFAVDDAAGPQRGVREGPARGRSSGGREGAARGEGEGEGEGEGGVAREPLAPREWLGVLLQRFWIRAAEGALGPRQGLLSRWLKLMLELELEHSLGLGVSLGFIESVAESVARAQVEGECLLLLVQVAAKQVERREQRRSGEGGDGGPEVSDEALEAWCGVRKALERQRQGVAKSSNRALIATAAAVGDVAERVMAAAEKLLC